MAIELRLLRYFAAVAEELHVTTMLRDTGVEARFQDSAHASTTEGMVAAGLGLTLSAPPWLEGAEGIVWRPLADVHVEIRTAAAWRPGNRSPLLRALVATLPAAGRDAARAGDAGPARPQPR